MKFEIKYIGQADADISNNLNQLSTSIIRDCDAVVQLIREPVGKGQKDSGLIIGLTIASLALSTIDSLFNILTYWQSQRTKYSVSFAVDGKTYTLEASSLNKLNEALTDLENKTKPKVEILITRLTQHS
jgi:hypothetical protein